MKKSQPAVVLPVLEYRRNAVLSLQLGAPERARDRERERQTERQADRKDRECALPGRAE